MNLRGHTNTKTSDKVDEIFFFADLVNIIHLRVGIKTTLHFASLIGEYLLLLPTA